MNPTSQNPGLSSGPNKKTLYATLAASAIVAFLFTLLLYVALSGRDPVPRVPYGILVSVLPALGALVFLRLTKRFASWRGVAIIYLVLFVVIVIIQAVSRMIPIFS